MLFKNRRQWLLGIEGELPRYKSLFVTSPAPDVSQLTCVFLKHHPTCHMSHIGSLWPRQQVELGDELALRYNDKSGHPEYDDAWPRFCLGVIIEDHQKSSPFI